MLDNLDAEYIFEMDADLSHPAEKIPEFLKEIEKGADFVIGSRFIKGGSIPNNWGSHRKIFEKLGFSKEGHFKEHDLFEGRYIDHIHYGLLRKDYHH